MEGDEPPIEPPAKVFFDIEPEISETPPPPVPQGGIVVGNLGDAPPSHKLTGDVNTFTQGGMFTAQLPAQPQKYRWGQYFIGLLAPMGVIFLLGGLLVLAESRADAYWEDYDNDVFREEYITLTPDEDGWFSGAIDESTTGDMIDFFSAEAGNETHTNIIERTYDGDYQGQCNGELCYFSLEEFVFNSTSDNSTVYSDVGAAYESNNTYWFKFTEAQPTTVEVVITYYNWVEDENAEAPMVFIEFIEGLMCLAPLAFIGVTIAAFAKGNKELGYGLISSIPATLVLAPILIFFIVIATLSL